MRASAAAALLFPLPRPKVICHESARLRPEHRCRPTWPRSSRPVIPHIRSKGPLLLVRPGRGASAARIRCRCEAPLSGRVGAGRLGRSGLSPSSSVLDRRELLTARRSGRTDTGRQPRDELLAVQRGEARERPGLRLVSSVPAVWSGRRAGGRYSPATIPRTGTVIARGRYGGHYQTPTIPPCPWLAGQRPDVPRSHRAAVGHRRGHHRVHRGRNRPHLRRGVALRIAIAFAPAPRLRPTFRSSWEGGTRAGRPGVVA
jgi:hypothetical protein